MYSYVTDFHFRSENEWLTRDPGALVAWFLRDFDPREKLVSHG